MALSFAFGGDTGTTYEDLKRRQAYAQAMWARGGQGSPKNAWEGLNSAAQSITGALLARKLGRELKAQQDEFGTMFNAALGGFGGQSASVPPAPKMNPVDQAYPVGMEGPAPERNMVTAGGKQYDMGTTAPWAGLEDVKAGIFAGESGGDYDALFGFSNRDGGKFAGNKLTDMTVDQALAFADPSGPYGQWVKGQVGRVATPMGAYQVVGTTLNAAKKAMGLRGDERMTPELQDQIGRWVHDTQGTGAWEGYRGPAKPGQAPSGGGGVTNPMLLSMISDPRASDAQRGVLQMLLQQQLQNADPMRKLQMQKLQAEIEATGKLTPYQRAQLDMAQARLDKLDPTSDQQNYKFYSDQVTAAGQTPLPFNDWMLQSKKAGATTVNIGGPDGPQAQIGTIPQGYVAIPDPKSPVGYRMGAIPGGPEDTSKADNAKKGNQETSTDIITTAASRAREAAGARFATGPFGQLAALNPYSDNAEVYRQVDVLKSNATIENLAAMRAASPTGGALGSVTEKENKMLADKAGALDPASPNFQRDLDDYERTLLRIVHGPEAGDKIFEQSRKAEPPATMPPAQTGTLDFSNMSIQDIGNIDISGLTDEQMTQMEARMKELGF